MTTATRRKEQRRFCHAALFYDGLDDLVEQTSRFVRDGAEAGEPTLVVVDAPKLERLRLALGPDAELVFFADMAEVGRNPARIIPAWREFVDAHAEPGVRLRGVGEPISPARNDAALVECQRHEQLLNLAFRREPLLLVCPYDTASLAPTLLDEARRSHPYVFSAATGVAPSEEWEGLEAAAAPFARPLPPAADGGPTFRFTRETLHDLRRFVAARALDAGIERRRVPELVLAANEVATNSIRHGGGRGTCRVWREQGTLLCEIRDAGRFGDPLAGRRQPRLDCQEHGYGLWVANDLCDLVQIRSLEQGTVTRLHVAIA